MDEVFYVTWSGEHYTTPGSIKIRNDHIYISMDCTESEEEVFSLNSFQVENITQKHSIIFLSENQLNGEIAQFEDDKDKDRFLKIIGKFSNSITDAIRSKSPIPININTGFNKLIGSFTRRLQNPMQFKTCIEDSSSDSSQTLSAQQIVIDCAKDAFTSDKIPYTLFKEETEEKNEKGRICSYKGELGRLQTFADDYQQRLHVYQLPSQKWPSNFTPVLISEEWTLHADLIWDWLFQHFKNPIIPGALFNFTWKSAVNDEDTIKWNNILHSTNIPIHFEKKDKIWELIKGKKTFGTCYRKGFKVMNHKDLWKSNAISNLFKIHMYVNSINENKTDEIDAKPIMTMYRHGIIGFAQKSIAIADHLVPQTYLLISDAIHSQHEIKRPMRFVSHNLVNQTKLFGTLNNERHMMNRQETALAVSIQMCIQNGICCGNDNPSLANFYLPSNTDKQLLAVKDSVAGINYSGSFKYLIWVCEDCCDVFSKILLDSDEYYNRKDQCMNDDSRWKNIKWLGILSDISFDKLADDIIEQCPSESKLLASLLSESKNSHDVFLNSIIDSVMLNEAMNSDNDSDATMFDSLCKSILAILSGIGSALYNELHNESIETSIDLTDLSNIKEDLQRCRISINLLRTLFYSEIFKKNDFQNVKEWAGLKASGRVFTRATSLLTVSLLDYCLGACVFVNCKSGLDRTGMFVGIQNAIISLWELYPQYRWDLHLVCINYNSIRKYELSYNADDFDRSTTFQSTAPQNHVSRKIYKLNPSYHVYLS